MLIVRRAAPLVLVTLWACGSGSAPTTSDANLSFPSAPLQTLMSDGGQLALELRSSPQPPARGVLAFRFTVMDKAGNPVDGLQLSVTPWMPSMGHGASVVPTVTPRGEGQYDVTNVDLFMPGQWQLRTKFSGAMTDSANPEFQID